MIPILHTDRLTLRAPGPGDFDALRGFHRSERSRFVGGPCDAAESWGYLCKAIGHWTMRGFGRWVVTLTGAEDRALGLVGLYHPLDWPEPEIAWTLWEGAEGRGIATEAARAARTYAYDTLGWSTAISLIAPDNTRSIALAERLGCAREGDFDHEEYGFMHIWRHPAAAEVSA